MQRTTTMWGNGEGQAKAMSALAPLVLVGGKGGVGKSFVAARLAAEYAAAGETVTLARFGDDQSSPAPVVAGVTVATSDPLEALRSQAGRILGSARLARMVLDQRAISGVLGLIPGVSEVALMLSLVELLGQGQDRVIVDMPATGHGLGLLTAPGLLLGVVDGGRAHDLTLALRDRLTDPARTSLVVVTTAEPFVLRETQQLARRAREAGFALALVVLNRMRSGTPTTTRELARRLAQRDRSDGLEPASDLSLRHPFATELGALADALDGRELDRVGLAAAASLFAAMAPTVGLEMQVGRSAVRLRAA